MKFSETQHRGVPLWIFLALWDKIFSTENLDTPPPFIHKHFFATGHFLKHRSEGFPYEFFWHCETKNFRRKMLILPPPLILKIFRYQKFVKQRRVPLWSFLVLWDNKFFYRKPWYPLLGIKFFDTRNFLRHRRVPRRNFWALWDGNFSTENRAALPKVFTIYLQQFSLPETSETLRGSYENFRQCETKNFRRKIVNPLFSYP